MTDGSTEKRRLVEAEYELRDASQQLRERSIALLEAHQELARIPLLEHRVEEIWAAREWMAAQNEELRRQNTELSEENRRLAELAARE
jgi:hypothetical protein